MDEFGSSVRHNDSPNVRCVPFLFMPSNVMFSLIWPIEDIPQGAEVTRDYAHGIEDETMRACKLIPWIEDIEDEDYEFDEGDPTQLEEPDMEYFTVYNSKNDTFMYADFSMLFSFQVWS